MNHNGEPTSQGSLLRGPWSLAVQLVGTFGLAVFLVLYYVLVEDILNLVEIGE